jgi:hypothetical protein
MQLFIISLLALILAAHATIVWHHKSQIHSFVMLACIHEELVARIEGALCYLITHYECRPELRERVMRERTVVVSLPFWQLDKNSAMKAIVKQQNNEHIAFIITAQKYKTVMIKKFEALVVDEDDDYVRVVVL